LKIAEFPTCDLDLGSGHTAYRHASLNDTHRPLPTYQISLKLKKRLWTDGRTYGHLRPTVLG